MRKFALGLAAVASMFVAAAIPASASEPPVGTTFWSGGFTGERVTYQPATACTTLPFVVHAELNNTNTAILVHKGKDCSGDALYFPAGDLHSFVGFDVQSFRAVS